MSDENRKTGLALGGGAVLGAAHVGVLRALEEHNQRVDLVAGTSIGAMIAAFFAFGLPAAEIEKITLDLDWLDVSGISLTRFGLLSNKKMAKVIEKYVGEVDIEDARTPLAVIATDVVAGRKVVIDRGPLADAVRASTAVPGIFDPVEIDGRLLVDGGVLENLPVSPLIDKGAQTIIASDLNSGQTYRRPDGIVGVLLNVQDMMTSGVSLLHRKNVDLLIAPDLSDFNAVDTDQAPDLIEAGYREAVRVLSGGGS